MQEPIASGGKSGTDNASLTRTTMTDYGIKSVPRDPLLVEREKTHGDFEDMATVSNTLKGIIRREIGRHSLNMQKVVHCEALDMIAVKIARIICGNANERDHWDDIAGYAKLGSEACDERR